LLRLISMRSFSEIRPDFSTLVDTLRRDSIWACFDFFILKMLNKTG